MVNLYKVRAGFVKLAGPKDEQQKVDPEIQHFYRLDQKPTLHAGAIRIVLFIVALVPMSGCKVLNSAFDGDPSQSETEDTAPVSKTQSNSTLGSTTSTPNNSEATTSSAAPSTEKGSASLSDQKNSQDSSSLENSGSQSTDDFNYLEFCERGAELCYPMQESSNNATQTLDKSDEKNHLRFTRNSGMTGGSHPQVPPLNRAMFTRRNSKIEAKDLYEYKGEDIGFDLWFYPDHTSRVGWTVFEIDGILALHRRGDGRMECVSTAAGNKSSTVAFEVKFDGMFKHISCSIQDNQLQMRMDNLAPRFSLQSVKSSAKDAALSFGRPASLIKSNPMIGRIAMLRVWEDVAAMHEFTKREYEAICGLISEC